ncbi:hypothetical protein HYDPIDRAFT_159357 [Hydnomerulius pinastri MD-312]|uniref:SANT domain-containing protein n=1 Tax=Hydnomerulius pinastri MD-312 TaxID=994086 RepID=A0A0C9WCH5_9AGAM|nr:hypothetical protein HYDPIDRAFT_159357 [Hydnomerulius pinastri MD-312]
MTSMGYGQPSPTGISLPHDFGRPLASFSPYDHPPRRRSPSPGPSARRQPYDSYKPRGGAPYRDDNLNSYRPNVYRPERFYSRSPSPPRYDRSRPQEARQWDNNTRWQSASYYDRRSTPSPPQWNKGRDTMAERMFEPSETWKQSHVDRPTRYELSENSPPDQYRDRRPPLSRDFSPQRPPARTDYPLHHPVENNYRPYPAPQAVRDLGGFSRTADTYRPQYQDDPWRPSYTADSTGPAVAHQQRRSSYCDHGDERPGSSIASTPPPRPYVPPNLLPKTQYRSPSPPPRPHTEVEAYRSIIRRSSIPDDNYRSYSPSVSRSCGSSISEEPPRKKFKSRSSSRSSRDSRPDKSGISAPNEGAPLPQTSIQSDTTAVETKASPHVPDNAPSAYDHKAPSEASSSLGSVIDTLMDNQTSSHETLHVNGALAARNEPLERNLAPPASPELVPSNNVTPPSVPAQEPPAPRMEADPMAVDLLNGVSQDLSGNDIMEVPGLEATAGFTSVSTSISPVGPDEGEVLPPSSTVTPSPVSRSLEKEVEAVPSPPCVEVDVDQTTEGIATPKPVPNSLQIVVSDHSTIPASPPPADKTFVFQSEPTNLKSTREGLRLVVLARLRCDRQSRVERAFPVLRANQVVSDLHCAPPPSDSQGRLYQELNGTAQSSDRLATHNAIRSSLVDRFTERQSEIVQKTRRLKEEYLTLHERWLEHCVRLDKGQQSGIQEESAIPSGGRATRRSAAVMGDAVRSDLEMEQIIASLGVEELTDPNYLAIKNVAKIPDMISVTEGSVPHLFDDTNNLIDDPAEFYGASSGHDYWTEEERNIFLNEFAARPKQFGLIAERLPNKTAAQCVTYYYMHKRRGVDFRKAVAQYGTSRRRKNGKTNKQRGNALLTDIRRHDDEVSRVTAGALNEGTPATGGKRKRAAILRTNGESRKASSSRRSTVQPEATPTSNGTTPDPEGDQQRRRRRTAVSTRAVTVVAAEEVVDNTAEIPSQDVGLKPARKARKPRKSKGQPAATPSEEPSTPMTEPSPPVDQQEPSARRKSLSTQNAWSEDDKSADYSFSTH